MAKKLTAVKAQKPVKTSRLTSLIGVSLALLIFSLIAAALVGYSFLYGDQDSSSNSKAATEKNKLYVAGDNSQDQSSSPSASSGTSATNGTFMQAEVKDYDALQNEIQSLINQKDDTAGLKLSKEMQFEFEQRIQQLRNRSRAQVARFDSQLSVLSGQLKLLERDNLEKQKLEALRAKRVADSTAQAKLSQQKLQTPINKLPVKEETPVVATSKPEPVVEKPTPTPTQQRSKARILASDMRISAVTGDENSETGAALRTEKLLCSAWLENASNEEVSQEITADLKRGGKTIQRVKVNFTASPNQLKKINFSMVPRDLKPGTYSLQLLQGNTVIGMASKYLQ
jgi:biopolymer transport protein ExbD